jgi:hypothetical protein
VSEESLITSTNEHMLLYSKSVVFIAILTLVVMLVYSTYSSNVFVLGKPISGGHIECDIDNAFLETITCCWFEDFGDYYAYVCQTCTEDGANCGPLVPTDTRDRQDTPPKQTIPPTIGDNVLQQEDGVLETQPADEGTVSPLKQSERGNLPESKSLEPLSTDEGTVQEPSSANEINQSTTVE